MAAINLNGYYPLYADEVEAQSYSTDGTTTEYEVSGTTYYVPTGVTFYPGTYYESGAPQEWIIFANSTTSVFDPNDDESGDLMSIVHADPLTAQEVSDRIDEYIASGDYSGHTNFIAVQRSTLPPNGWWAYDAWVIENGAISLDMVRAKIVAYRFIKTLVKIKARRLLLEERLGLINTSVLDDLRTNLLACPALFDSATDFEDLKTKLLERVLALAPAELAESNNVGYDQQGELGLI